MSPDDWAVKEYRAVFWIPGVEYGVGVADAKLATPNAATDKLAMNFFMFVLFNGRNPKRRN
jgi:hypothetical protein